LKQECPEAGHASALALAALSGRGQPSFLLFFFAGVTCGLQ
jgi:hypothetical protein